MSVWSGYFFWQLLQPLLLESKSTAHQMAGQQENGYHKNSQASDFQEVSNHFQGTNRTCFSVLLNSVTNQTRFFTHFQRSMHLKKYSVACSSEFYQLKLKIHAGTMEICPLWQSSFSKIAWWATWCTCHSPYMAHLDSSHCMGLESFLAQPLPAVMVPVCVQESQCRCMISFSYTALSHLHHSG